MAAPAADFRPEVAAQWIPLEQRKKPAPASADLPRPAWLLEEPIQLLMRANRPFYGSPLPMMSTGERIECGWEDGRAVTRDYFVGEDDNGVHFWLFCQRVSARDARPSELRRCVGALDLTCPADQNAGSWRRQAMETTEGQQF